MEGVWRLRAAMAKTGDREKPLFLRLKGCVSKTRHREGREGEQEPGGCPASPGEQEGTLNVLVPPL